MNEVDSRAVYFNGPGPASELQRLLLPDSGTLPGTQVYAATGLAILRLFGTS